jgi:hypothetical protein
MSVMLKATHAFGTQRVAPFLAVIGLLAAFGTPRIAFAQKDREPVLRVDNDLERNVRRALDDRISKDLGKSAKIDVRTSEEYDVSSSERGVRGRAVATVDGDDRALRYDVILNKTSNEARRVRYNWLDGSGSDSNDGSVSQKTRRLISQELENKIRKDTGKTVNVELRTWDDYDAGENRDGVRGRAFADFSTGDDKTLKYDAVLNSRSDDVERVRYDFVDDSTDGSNQRLRRIAKDALEDEIKKDRDKDVTVNIRDADDYSVSNSETGLRGKGTAKFENRQRDFTFDMVINTRSGKARHVDYDFTDRGGSGNSREEMFGRARRAIRNRLIDKHGDDTQVFFDKPELRKQGGNNLVEGTGRYSSGNLAFQNFHYKVTLDNNGKVLSADSNRD